MSFVQIYIHLVFSTQEMKPFLNSKVLRIKVWNHINENATEKGIHIGEINGYSDHCHCLISLGRNQEIAKIAQLIKGESSFWINRNNLTADQFRWQDEYFAVSVSASGVEEVRNLLNDQESYHTTKPFLEEYSELIKKHGF
ncbi:transposase [Kaistella palustris]|uniref:transposase n=1 Tax=Kaistella palustris TaxID=493376 RepID=UPI000484955B|nr:transposase [Kaistella palustris]